MRIASLLFSALLFGSISSSEANQFYTARLKIIITHTTLMSGTRTVFKTQGKVRFSEGGVCVVEIGKETYRCGVDASDWESQSDLHFWHPISQILSATESSDDHDVAKRIIPFLVSDNTYTRFSSGRQLSPSEEIAPSDQVHTKDPTESFHIRMKMSVPRRL